MLEIRRILCAIDFSDVSRHALDHAIVIAGWYGSSLTALHVCRPALVPTEPVLFSGLPGAVRPTESDGQAVEKQLQEWLRPALAAGLRADGVVVEGNPTRRILDRAKALPADLVVMGTHGHGGFERLVLGSVAEKVLRKARCPVLTVPPPAVATSMLPFRRVLCPVDFSEPSLAALELGLSLAQESNGKLTILHVREWPLEDEELATRHLDVPESFQQWEVETTYRLDALIPDEARNWCAPEPRLSHGKPYHQILRIAGQEQVDVIVMGVHGRNALDVMLFGSTTNQVVRRASCPVLTLRT